ncbi:MAG TPA: hypothetical protein VFC80_04735 [Sphaerochaeta sp.]|nr:hypothetical protein [Sphaerochaeta sp.]
MFDRSKLTAYPLNERKNLVDITTAVVDPSDTAFVTEAKLADRVEKIASDILQARKNGSAVMLAFGAHAIKNGLGRLLGEMASRGWFTHLATNGAGIIHDWEFAYQGESSEDVRANVAEGKFGTWDETGLYLNLALAVGAFEGLGYGESVGKMIVNKGLTIPSSSELTKSAAGLDLLELLETLKIAPGFLSIEHPYASYSVQGRCYSENIPCTSHPMFGHDIIYTHKAMRGAAIGRTAERDFLRYVSSVADLAGGVYLSVGSAVMSPMIFEKSLSMARNIGIPVDHGAIHVVDLAPEGWDWSTGEPPMDNPAYYLRYMKTFSRMGLETSYLSSDNRDFFVALYRALEKQSEES